MSEIEHQKLSRFAMKLMMDIPQAVEVAEKTKSCIAFTHCHSLVLNMLIDFLGENGIKIDGILS